ncbi:MAG: CPBP family intramembrane glutamic endopeptidase [Gemmatimonadaceae bacterium]|nr:CPBP family intramembrane glutamic endopeptidase [Gemmatimonadaceae bacterium]
MGEYWRLTRRPRYAVLAALPLLVLYHLSASLTGSTTMNGAEALLLGPFVAVAGRDGPWALVAGLVLTGAWFVARDVRGSGAPKPRIFVAMLGESAAWAVATGIVLSVATATLLQRTGLLAMLTEAPPWSIGERLTISIGAGLYEELLFRVIAVPVLAWLVLTATGARAGVATGTAVVLSALLFSAMHHVGAYGEPFTVQAFVFRTLAGLWFSGLYVARGFGVAAWSHALYDVGVLVL